jgi:DinB family protein
MVLHPQLAAALRELESAAAGLPADALARRAGGRWSAADILEHLTLAFGLNAAAFDRAVESGTIKVRAPKLTQRLGRFVVIGLGYFPRVEAPDATRPRGSVPVERSVAALRDAVVALDAAMKRFVERFGEDVPAANHPYFAALTVRQWRAFHWRHAVHHARQVKQRGGGVQPF